MMDVMDSEGKDVMKKKTGMLRWGPLLMALPMLGGCVLPVVMGGAAVSTATVATDRRTAGTIVSDEVIEQRVSVDIAQSLPERNNHITVTSYEGRVLLSGEAQEESDKETAENVASLNTDVTSIINELAVMEPVSVGQRISDSMLATRVRSALIGTENVSLNQMKVTVERGIVYLMGVVTAEEAQLAGDTAARVSGVMSVVKCFSIVSAEEVAERLRNLQSTSGEENAAGE